MSELESFRTEIRSWIEANCPPEMRTPANGDGEICWGGRNFVFKNEAQKLWMQRCAEAGLTVPDWPKDCGGAGLVPCRNQDFPAGNGKSRGALTAQQLWHLDVGSGVAPIRHRRTKAPLSAANRARRNPLVSGLFRARFGERSGILQTFGEDMGDHWIVNGQKVWTSYADKADWIFCLVRTDKANKYQGISFLLFDMETPRRLHQADQANQRQFTLLRDIFRQCESAQAPDCRRA